MKIYFLLINEVKTVIFFPIKLNYSSFKWFLMLFIYKNRNNFYLIKNVEIIYKNIIMETISKSDEQNNDLSFEIRDNSDIYNAVEDPSFFT